MKRNRLSEQPVSYTHLDVYKRQMLFTYSKSYTSGTPEAYETLLLDILLGDATLFMRADKVEAAWKILMPVINAWEAAPPTDFPNYDAGTEGLDEAMLPFLK